MNVETDAVSVVFWKWAENITNSTCRFVGNSRASRLFSPSCFLRSEKECWKPQRRCCPVWQTARKCPIFHQLKHGDVSTQRQL